MTMSTTIPQQGQAALAITPQERIDRLAMVSAEQMAAALKILAGYDPAALDFVLDAAEPCDEDGDPDASDEAEPHCAVCGADVGIFLKFGLDWRHYHGDGTTTGPIEVFDAGHDPVVTWLPAEDLPARR
jgi:hypothetical protein